MQKSWLRPRWFKAGLFAQGLALAVTAVSQAGWAQGAASVVLGQPLNFSVQLRTDSGEPVTPECIAAEVSAGDRRLPAAQVRTALESLGPEGARIRVTTTQRIDDAVVSVQLTVGCQARVTRRYMLMADPAIAVAAAGGAEATTTAPTLAPSPAAGLPSATAPLRASASQRNAPRAERPAAAAAPRGAKPERAAPPRAAAVGARLQLDPADAMPSAESAAVEQAIEVVAQAATAMRAAMAAASAAEQRIKSLERSVEQARNEASAQRDLVLKLQAQAAAPDSPDPTLWPWQLAWAATAALALFMGWRLWKQAAATATAPAPDWRGADGAVDDPPTPDQGPGRAVTRPAPFVESEPVLPSSPTRPPATAQAGGASRFAASEVPSQWDAADSKPAFSTPANERTAPLPAGVREAAGTARDVSIEELLDLEQQAEFFIVLGQDSSAIDLLVEHLRLTGGGSPLPYLKLMEIYHRLGEQDAYERTRSRFNDRFNAYAPAWTEGPQSGRSLEAYPGILPRLSQAWGRPLDAMAELEALLFRKSRGDLFDLPAYRDVLFLYSLARDLFDHESGDAATVDLLLPIHGHDDLHSTRPAPFDDPGHSLPDGMDDAQGRPTAPVDLDLSTPDKSSSIFDPFDPHARPGRR